MWIALSARDLSWTQLRRRSSAGTAFVGGRGGLLGTIAGVLLIQLLSTMAVLMGLDIEVQFIIKGLVILGAVTLYSLASTEA